MPEAWLMHKTKQTKELHLGFLSPATKKTVGKTLHIVLGGDKTLWRMTAGEEGGVNWDAVLD